MKRLVISGWWLVVSGWCLAVAGEPTGCPEFTVERPRKLESVQRTRTFVVPESVRAEEFGFSVTNTRNAAAIGRAIAEAKRIGASGVELKSGTYLCCDEPGFELEGLTDFTLDGKGATLVFWRPAPSASSQVPQWKIESDGGCVSVRNCTRTWLKDFNIDWDWSREPLASRAIVVAVNGRGRPFVDFDLPEGHPAYPRRVPILVGEAMDPTFSRFRNGPGHFFVNLSFGSMGLESEWLSSKRLRVFFDGRADEAVKFDVGGAYRLLHRYYGDNAVMMDSNRHLTLSRVNVFAARGMAFQVRGRQRFWRIEDCTVAPPVGSTRVISSTADANHVAQSCGYCQMVNYRVRLNSDDCSNFHDRTTIAVKSGDCGLRVINDRGARFFGAETGDEIELLNADFSPAHWRGRIVKVTEDGYVMDRPTPKETNYAFVLANRTYGTDNILLRNCEFTDATARTLIHGCNVTVENCSWKRTCATPLRFLAVWTKNVWCEGTGCTNVIVRNCRFEHDNIWRWNVAGRTAEIVSFAFTPERFGDQSKDAAPDVIPWEGAVSDILVENCVFVDPIDLTWQKATGRGLIERNNRIERK